MVPIGYVSNNQEERNKSPNFTEMHVITNINKAVYNGKIRISWFERKRNPLQCAVSGSTSGRKPQFS